MTIANTNLEEQYRFTRAALVSAGLDMNGSIDALYRDWRRWRTRRTSWPHPIGSLSGTPTNGGLGI
jgi:hypothetical protein